jgi:PAS domain S-box-containing protein
MLPEESGSEIRRRAEEIALRRSDEEDSPQDRLIYELKVHQIELEMQNNELQESQQELQRSRQRYEILFDFAPVAYFVLNAEGGIIEANHAAAGLLRTERRFLDRKPFVVFLANEYHAAFFSHLKRIFAQGNRQTVDIQLNTRQGGLLWARLESRMQRGSRGEPQCLTAILDISDRKKIEDDLILAREDAISSSRAKSAFLANISHEIRTPMSGILAMSELAMQQTDGEEIRRSVTTINSAAQSLLAILDDVRDVTRLETSELTIEGHPFRLHDLVTALQAMFQPSAARKEIALVIEVPDNLSETLIGDRNRIRQVLVSLLDNAITFTESGSVTLRLREQEVSSFLCELTFEVADTGPGISPEEERRIFQTFNAAHDEADTRYDGKGIGLSIARRLARLMGGQLYFETTPGKGSRFFFSVPLEIPTEEDETSHAPAPPLTDTVDGEQAHGRILVAEDNAINLLVIRTVLEKAGYHVTSVGNGRDAIALLERGEFDLVLMDISMPGMDGVSATKEIRALEDSGAIRRGTPIVAITAHSMAGDRERFLATGMNDYISKPFVRSTILATVQSNLRRPS